jgi:calpain-7
MDRNKLIQKLNEYRHRIEQLERYMDATKANSPSIYINENSPYQQHQRRDVSDSEIARTEEDEYNDKANVYKAFFFSLFEILTLKISFRLIKAN